MAELQFVIWSNEHRRFWMPAWNGYTWTLSEAGRYSEAEADVIVRQANIALPPGEEPNEVMLLAPECLEIITASPVGTSNG
jgi:hypothetical protein